jgi:hypothetical protein
VNRSAEILSSGSMFNNPTQSAGLSDMINTPELMRSGSEE